MFNSHQCLRQLALIECPGVAFTDLPVGHVALLEYMRERREKETCEHVLWSDIRQAAIRRLAAYSRDDARGYANARFLKLVVADDAAAQVTKSGGVSSPRRHRNCISTTTRPDPSLGA